MLLKYFHNEWLLSTWRNIFTVVHELRQFEIFIQKIVTNYKIHTKIIYMVYKLPLIIFCCWKSFVDVPNKAILKSLLYCTKISFLHNPHLINVLINVRICLNFFIIKILKIIRELCSSKTLEKLSNMSLLLLKCDTHQCTCKEQKSNTDAEEYNR